MRRHYILSMPGTLLALDPGADTGWALFADKRLTGCGLGNPPDSHRHECFAEVVIECPVRVNRGIPDQAILKLARNAGEWAGRYAECAEQITYVSPNDWKGSTSKDVSHARLWAKLDAHEQGVVDAAFRAHPGRNGLAPSKRHNVLDAIGIGLHGVGR